MSSTITEIAQATTARAKALDLGHIVGELRSRRSAARQARKAVEIVHELPSRQALGEIVESLLAVLYPRHFGPIDLCEDTIDFFVGNTLHNTLRVLLEQIRRELRLDASRRGKNGAATVERRAQDIVYAFAESLPDIRSILDSDVTAAFEGDPAAQSFDEVLFCYPGITAIAYHRIAHTLHGLKAPLLARIIAEIAHSKTGIDIHPGAQVGSAFFIDHGTGVVIGETAIIGQRVRVYQAVTLGAKRFPVNEDGTLIKGNARHPIVEDDVVIYAGATILGRVTIGRGSTIGGNVWLTRSVPPDSNITQAQVRNEMFDEGGGI